MDKLFTKKIFEADLVPRQIDGQVPTGKEMLKFIQVIMIIKEFYFKVKILELKKKTNTLNNN